jgi:hypothetical protein
LPTELRRRLRGGEQSLSDRAIRIMRQGVVEFVEVQIITKQ